VAVPIAALYLNDRIGSSVIKDMSSDSPAVMAEAEGSEQDPCATF
jgi:hypothetical protein